MFIKENKIYIGDTHSIATVCHLISSTTVRDTTFIHVGDVGIGFTQDDENWLSILNELLIMFNNNLIAVRGNHDDPSWWNEGKCKHSNIYLVPDYTVIQDHLFIGGAISIDRMNRKEGVSWWKDEKLVYKPVSHLTGIKTVVTHNVPTFLPPYGISKLVREFHDEEKYKYKTDLITELVEEREILDKIFYELPPIENWVAGHMHLSNKQDFKGTTFYQLGINEKLIW